MNRLAASQTVIPNTDQMGSQSRLASLTRRELECLSALADGLKADQIASKLQISPPTVAMHVTNAKRKLGALTREHAIAIALRSGWLS